MGEVASVVLEKSKTEAENAGIKLSMKEGRNLPLVSGDAKSLERALMALVDNAIKFSPDGGYVKIRLNNGRGKVFVSVEDQGIGISPEARPRIFDRFYHLEKSGDNLFGGIGLGLSITRQVIRQHKGAIDVESTPGKGSTFSLSLQEWIEK